MAVNPSGNPVLSGFWVSGSGLGSGFRLVSCMSTGPAMGKLGAASIAHMGEEAVY